MVSLTAANTSRMLLVSVACVRLKHVSYNHYVDLGNVLRVQVEVGPIDLIKAP